ncbi:hypothetical protein CQW23_10651 [Capsicum baccatum]|uniref:Ubiquitin-like protease family profile domain-containing protein n=1 Tax=Capsicum baccatum TaxID=33114 RepID=A0A2G2X081_CAPBA|nr:hypothetical protein CQW23_10651 [Capsicum baccatum]
MDKVMRSVFYDDFVNKKITFRVEDLYEIELVYFISRFLQSELPRTFIKKADFDLIESGHYLKYDWGVVNNHVNDQSPLDDIPFFTESQLVSLEPTFRVLETPKAHIFTPIMFDKSPVDVYNQSDTSSRRCLLHFMTAYIDKSLSESLEYVILKDTPQQEPQSNDCGMLICAFAEYVSHGIFDISSRLFDAVNHRIRYGALLWNYARRKQNDGAISKSEAIGNVTSKHGGFKRSREQFGSTRTR